MWLYSKYIKTVVYTCSAFAFLVGAHLISVFFFAIHQFEVSYDPQFATQAQSDIAAYIHNYPTRSLSFKQLEQSLQHAYPCIASIQAKAQPNGIITVHIDAIEPLYLLNDEHVITAHNSIVDAHYYISTVTQKLPILQVALQPDQKRLPQQMFTYLSTLNKFNIPDMAIAWKQPHDVHVHLCSDNIRLRCNSHVAPDHELFDRCLQIAQEYKRSSVLARRILADMRFDNQIIISKIKKSGEAL